MEYQYGALYIRVSTTMQEELSPDAQKRLLLEYAKKNKIMIRDEHIFMENGISGRNAKKRPEFQKMIAIAKQKPSPFQVVLVWKYSRFARNQEESIFYKSMLKKQCGVDVISTSEPLIDGPFGGLIERIIEWMDEYYSINLSGEVTRGMTENALRGGYQSAPVMGYRAVGDGKPYVVVQEEAKIVQYIFDQYVNHHKDPTSIARQINDMGLRTKKGNLFERRRILYTLQNRFYIGELRWGGIVSKGTHETFISEELFEKAQERIRETFRQPKQKGVSSCKHWLSGIVKCSICGSSLSYSKGTCTPYFQCWKYLKGQHREGSYINEKKLTKAVLDYFEEILNGGDFELTYIEPVQQDDTELQSYKNELKKLENREKRIKEAYESGVDSLEEYKENKTRLLAERRRIEGKIAGSEREVNVEGGKKDFLRKVQTVYDVIKSDDVDHSTKGTFVRSVLEEIVYNKENDTLTFRLYSVKKHQ